MKAIVTFLFVLLICFTAQARDAREAGFDAGITKTFKEVKPGKEKEVARLYRFKNSRVKKELSFSTKRNKAKLA